MNKIIYVLIFLFIIPLIAFSQKMPVDYFEEGYKFYEANELDSALSRFNFIVQNFPEDESYPRALNNVGVISIEFNKLEDAKKVFLSILKSGFNEEEPLGGDIMGDPSTNYKHRAAEHLSDIYYKQKDFTNSLKYLVLADTVYKYIGYDANAYEEQDILFAIKYADIYDNTGLRQKAISSLLKCVFYSFAAGDFKDKLYAKIKELFIRYEYTDVKDEFDKSLNNFKKEKRFSEDRNREYYLYYINFLQTKIYLPDSYDNLTVLKESEIVSNTKKFRFYKFLDQFNK